MKRISIAILIVLVINTIVIGASVSSGREKGDLMLRFHERQSVTFLSALMLGLTSAAALVLYSLAKATTPQDRSRFFWLLCSIGFFYLCMDEYFMAHEGMDEAVGALFGKDIKELNLDNLVIAFFGLVAGAICFIYRKVILRQSILLTFLFCGLLGLIGTVVFHSFERINIVYEVVEESFKLLGVSFFFTGFLLTMLEHIKGLSAYIHTTRTRSS